MKINKKLIAREWLILIVALILGLFIMPKIDQIFNIREVSQYYSYRGNLSLLKDELLSGKIGSYGFVLIPYFLLQICRSIYWSIKVMSKGK